MRRPLGSPLALSLSLSASSAALAQTPPPAAANAQPTENAQPAASTPSTEATPPAEGAGSSTTSASAPAEPAASETRANDAIRPTPAPPDLLDRITSAVVLHGNLRVRPELMHNFGIGWDRPSLYNNTGAGSESFDYRYSAWPWARNPENGLGSLCSLPPPPGSSNRIPADCSSNYQTMANLRLRFQPEIHVTDAIAVYAQVDLVDNLIMGSTPQGYYSPAGSPSPWAPTTAMAQTQAAPTGSSALVPSVNVSRAWAEVTNATLGQIRFGRMPWHWGLGILSNGGNGIDSDYQTHVDRIMYQFRYRPLGLFAAAMYDFASTGMSTVGLRRDAGQGQPIDTGTFDDVNQYGLAVGRRVDAAEARQALSRGDFVWNGGIYGLFRRQVLSSEGSSYPSTPTNNTDWQNLRNQYVRRDATIGVADLWFQLLHRNFRLEIEAAFLFGNMNFATTPGDPNPRVLDVFQFGGALEAEYRLLNNRLQIEFRAGYASGDADIEGLNYHVSPTGAAPLRPSAQASTLFTFHPDYRVDLILWRQVFRQVSGAYYFRPGVMYAFVDRPGADRFYGRASVIWSRASQFVQTRGNAEDLGIEVDAELTYISNYRDTSLGNPPAAGFYASLQYGLLFPMAGLGPTDTERNGNGPLRGFEFSNAQTLRGVLGVLF